MAPRNAASDASAFMLYFVAPHAAAREEKARTRQRPASRSRRAKIFAGLRRSERWARTRIGLMSGFRKTPRQRRGYRQEALRHTAMPFSGEGAQQCRPRLSLIAATRQADAGRMQSPHTRSAVTGECYAADIQ